MRCPSCNAGCISDIGAIPPMQTFAGNTLQIKFPPSRLFRCRCCKLYFRWPSFDRIVLNKLYESGNPNHWQYDFDDRQDWQITIDWINGLGLTDGRILDVGCWDGTFLERIRDWRLYGVEINPSACAKAMKRGIKLLSHDIYETKSLTMLFDVVTAFDVIEHLSDPCTFIMLLLRLTKPGGYLIISSGDAESSTWKISRSKCIYSTNPEHISFVSRSWCDFMSAKLDLPIVYFARFTHGGKTRNVVDMLIDILQNIIYLSFPRILATSMKTRHLYLKKRVPALSYGCPPPWGYAKDHMLAIFRKS